jgi:hypothetical protein
MNTTLSVTAIARACARAGHCLLGRPRASRLLPVRRHASQKVSALNRTFGTRIARTGSTADNATHATLACLLACLLRTALWCSFPLLDHGFQACQCTPSTCKACIADASGTRKRKHSVRWEQTSTAKSAAFARQAVPPQLSQQVGHALCRFIPTLASWQQPGTTATGARARGVAA